MRRQPIEVPEYIANLSAYQPGKPVEVLQRELGITSAIKVASNENPLGPSPLAVAAVTKAMGSMHLYPDGGCFELRQALALHHGLPPEEFAFGTGSNNLIHLLVQALCTPGRDQVLSHEVAFISYRLSAMSRGVDFVAAPINSDMSCNVDAMIECIGPATKLVFLANPNNPTGRYVAKAEFERLLEAMPPSAVLVVDEAYYEYAVRGASDYPDSLSYRQEAPCPMVLLRTFSKVHALAGLRIGYAICDADIANYIDRVRKPFNVSGLAQAAALASLPDTEHADRSAQLARDGLAKIADTVTALGCTAYPSLTNFVLIDTKRDAAAIETALAKRGVIVRPMLVWGLPTCIRVSVAMPDNLEKVCAELRAVFS